MYNNIVEIYLLSTLDWSNKHVFRKKSLENFNKLEEQRKEIESIMFSTDTSLLKALFLATKNANKKWSS